MNSWSQFALNDWDAFTLDNWAGFLLDAPPDVTWKIAAVALYRPQAIGQVVERMKAGQVTITNNGQVIV